MNDEVKVVFLKDLIGGCSISKINVIKFGFGAGKFGNLFKDGFFAVDEIVDDSDVVALID